MPAADPLHSISITYKALRYLFHENAFLTVEQAQYGLERLWELVAGEKEWEGDLVLEIPAVDEVTVRAMFALNSGRLQRVPLASVLPPALDLGLDSKYLPALCECPGEHFKSDVKSVRFQCDLVAGTYLLLSRWEENSCDMPKDSWGNVDEKMLFPARQGFLDRPVLDEWGLVFRAWICAFYPQWSPNQSSFRIQPTHDIDHLLRYPRARVIPRRAIGAVVRSRSLRSAINVTREAIAALRSWMEDPCIMAIHDMAMRNELLGLRGRFFFMSALAGPFDDGYDLTGRIGQEVIKDLFAHGQEIGWHPGYRAAEDQDRFFDERKRIESAVEGASKATRFHYLRWRRKTPALLEAIGAKEDQTWGMNDNVGFAQGTCRPFALWDSARGFPISVIETPLIMQDNSLLRAADGDLSKSTQIVKSLLSRTKRVSGCFSFLLHNNPNCGSLNYGTVADAIYGCLN